MPLRTSKIRNLAPENNSHVEENPYLKPYVFHGLDLPRTRGSEAIGECPFCGRSKLSINTSQGTWRCWRCGEGTQKGGGNWITFLRLLWQHSEGIAPPGDYKSLAEERGLLSWETLTAWGVRSSLICGDWLVPGFQWDHQAKGFKLMNLYRWLWSPNDQKYVLWQTPGKELSPPLTPQLFGVNLYDPKRPYVWLAEGAWDAMALWEVLENDKRWRGKCNVLGTPGTNIFKEEWAPLFQGKDVIICYDNDHPKWNEKLNKETPGAGIQGVKRVTRTLMNAKGGSCTPKSIRWLKWGSEGEGYDKEVESGYDLRDLFQGSITDRKLQLGYVEERLETVPTEWASSLDTEGPQKLQPVPCTSWEVMIEAWKKAMSWTEGLHYGLAFGLSVVISTKSVGDPLWGVLMSPPSTGKTTLAEAMSVASKYVMSRSTLKGFHSGYREKGDTKDHSLMARCNGMTLIFKDADTIMRSSNRDEIMAQLRDIYDGAARTDYKVQSLNREYTGHRMTVLMCGTGGLRELDAAELGARFLTYSIMEKIDDVLEDEILLRVAIRAERNVNFESNGEAESQDDPALVKAKQLTGGYVEYLRQNAQVIISGVTMSREQLVQCTRLGKFVAFMRARPSKKQDESAEREFGARLVSQMTRLAKCMSAVLGKKQVDEEVMTQVRKVAIDTAQGRTLHLARILYEHGGEVGLTLHGICHLTGDTQDREAKLLWFLKKIHAVEKFQHSGGKVKLSTRYKLTPTLRTLYEQVMGGKNAVKE